MIKEIEDDTMDIYGRIKAQDKEIYKMETNLGGEKKSIDRVEDELMRQKQSDGENKSKVGRVEKYLKVIEEKIKSMKKQVEAMSVMASPTMYACVNITADTMLKFCGSKSNDPMEFKKKYKIIWKLYLETERKSR